MKTIPVVKRCKGGKIVRYSITPGKTAVTTASRPPIVRPIAVNFVKTVANAFSTPAYAHLVAHAARRGG